MGVITGWLSDPQASATIVVGIAAGLFAVYQLRAYPAERMLRINGRMKSEYGKSAPARGDLLKRPYPLMLAAYDEILNEVERIRLSATQSSVLRREEATATRQMYERYLNGLRQEGLLWSQAESGLSFLAAHEVLQSDFKFRALLHCIETIRSDRDDRVEEAQKAAVAAVNGMNDLAVDYWNGVYPARTLLGLVHRSLATSCKAVLPFIWERSLDGRWGRRVLHLGIAAEHYNDVTPLHWSSSVEWTTRNAADEQVSVVVHQRMMNNLFGKHLPCTESFAVPRTQPRLRLHGRAWYWRAVGALNPRPRIWMLAFGGWRLRQHRKAENDLAALLRLALSKGSESERASLSFDWCVSDLKDEVSRTHRQHRVSQKEERRARRNPSAA